MGLESILAPFMRQAEVCGAGGCPLGWSRGCRPGDEGLARGQARDLRGDPPLWPGSSGAQRRLQTANQVSGHCSQRCASCPA